MSGESILLVEDNDAVALGLQMGLQRERYQVTRAASVGDARTKAREADFHLFILEVSFTGLGSGS